MKRRTVLGAFCGGLLLPGYKTAQSQRNAAPAGPSITFDIHVKRPEILDDIGWRDVNATVRLPMSKDGEFSGKTDFDDGAKLIINGRRVGSNVELELLFVRQNWIIRTFKKTVSLTKGSLKIDEQTNGEFGGKGSSGDLLFSLSIEVNDGFQNI